MRAAVLYRNGTDRNLTGLGPDRHRTGRCAGGQRTRTRIRSAGEAGPGLAGPRLTRLAERALLARPCGRLTGTAGLTEATRLAGTTGLLAARATLLTYRTLLTEATLRRATDRHAPGRRAGLGDPPQRLSIALRNQPQRQVALGHLD